MWVFDQETNKISMKPCTYVPGLYKIFDEILVNAADNKQRDPSMNKMEVTIDRDDGFISVLNNGKSIPIVMHKEHNVYVPELVFGHLLTGSNFDDQEEKTTGGRNGYGAKLANIFSTKFVVEIGDQANNLQYKQEFSNNMTVIGTPKLTKYSGSDFTKVTFYPDFNKFKMPNGFNDDDIFPLLCKRVYDIAGGSSLASGPKLNVKLNSEKIDVKKFEDYVLFLENIESSPPVAFEKINDRWEIGVGPSDGSFQQVSFVNSICTSKGGAHVTYITDQITSRLVATLKKKSKEEMKPHQIKNHLAIYINCLITNPAFDSQTKEFLTTRPSAFGSTCVIPEKIFKAIEKSSIIENILNWNKFKQNAELKKKASGSKKSKLIGITKLDDANYAGTSKSSQCTLILTEGDSAKALAISGLGVVGRDYYGVFPLKGKLLNVREATHQQILKNEEIQNITKILGLTHGKVYNDTSSLRYGHLMIMTDQDHDGSHIKGLLINFIHYFWPSLLKIPGFLQQFITPIVKCSKGKEIISFYTIPEYHAWKESHNDGKGWKIKYYKGLGTSTAQEAKEYFSNLNTHEINFQWDDKADDCIDMAFAKKRVDDRKFWLLSMKPGVHIDYTDDITYDRFINHELILFSHADNERSIAHLMDGLKPSQRKVLFSCFKRNLTKQEIKVAQLAGYVSEHSAYHHGEASLTQTIIGMAQNFVGSNNLNLLAPCGQFGTRLMGGKDAASPRYVFTKLEEITRLIFHPDDDNLLEYLDEDGQLIEPSYYVPVIPMALVNGSEGIGTGWSSTIPNYNPFEIIQNLRKMIQGDEVDDMAPWYRGFHGGIQGKEGKNNSTFTVTGTVEQIDEQTVQITELPVGKWTTDYKQFLESVLIGNPNNAAATKEKESKEDGTSTSSNALTPFVKDFKENHTDTSVLFTVTCLPEKLQEFANEKGGLAKRFKLESSIATSNMNLFDVNGQIRKYETPTQIMKDFFFIRLQLYIKRRQSLCNQLDKEWKMLDNKMRFITEVIQGTLIISNRKKAELLNELQRKGYETFYSSPNNNADSSNSDKADGEQESEEETKGGKSMSLEKGYDYLLSMKLWNLTNEKVRDLQTQRDGKFRELEELKAKTAEMIWMEDLQRLEAAIVNLYSQRDEEEQSAQPKGKGKKKASATIASTSSKSQVVLNSKSEKVVAKPPIPPPTAAATKTKKIQPTGSFDLLRTVSEDSTESTSSVNTASSQRFLNNFYKSLSMESNDSTGSTTMSSGVAAVSRPARATKKAVKYISDEEEEDDDDAIDLMSESEEELVFSDDDSDEEASFDEKPKAKSKSKSKARPNISTTTTSSKAKVEVGKSNSVVENIATGVVKPATKPAAKPKAAPRKKKALGDDDEEDDDSDAFLIDDDEDESFDEKPKKKASVKEKAAKPTKEPKEVKSKGKAKVDKIVKENPTTSVLPQKTEKKTAVKRSQSKKKDEDEDDAILLSPPVAAVKKAKREEKLKEVATIAASRAVRERKPTNYATFYGPDGDDDGKALQDSDVSDSFVDQDDESDFSD